LGLRDRCYIPGGKENPPVVHISSFLTNLLAFWEIRERRSKREGWAAKLFMPEMKGFERKFFLTDF
jgi:hypothetical protein